MRTTLSRSWKRAALSAAIPALLFVTQVSWGQDDLLGSGPPGSFFSFGKQADEVFEKYASLASLGTAWREMDSAMMTDSALQFAEGERVLLRSHKLIAASQVFDIAIRLATENGDKASLERLAKAFDRSGDKVRLAQVNLALKTTSAARSVDPVLNEGNADARSAIRSILDEIQSARIAGSKPQLEGLEKSLAELRISEKQRATLKKVIAETAESLGVDNSLQSTVDQLDKLGGVLRPISKVKEAEGGKFLMPDYSAELPIEEQISFFTEQMGKLETESGSSPELPTDPLVILSKPSRKSGWTDQLPFIKGDYAYNAYGVGSLFQYTNMPGPYFDQNCGQAAVATMLTYHGKWQKEVMAKDGTTQIQKTLEKPPFNPDIPRTQISGGTTPMRVMSACNNYGLNTWLMGGHETKLRYWVSYKYPCIAILDVGKAGWGKNGLHYTVVYAYDANNYWCTNWQGSCKVPRTTFLNSWVVAPNADFILTQPKK